MKIAFLYPFYSAASPMAWELHGSATTTAQQVDGDRPSEALPCNSQAVGEAALAVELITASKSLHASTVFTPSNPYHS